MNEEEKILVKELMGKIHDAMDGYTGTVRFDALSQVLAAGIVAYGHTPEEEAKVFGAIVYDLVRDIDKLQEFRAEVKETAERIMAEAAESTIN